MEITLAGLLGAVAGTAIGAANYVMVVPLLAQRLRALDKSETAAQREAFEAKLAVMRRVILGIDVLVFGGLGYWIGTQFLAPLLG